MNHRDLILSAKRKTKHKFLTLPEKLQDEIVKGLDERKMSLEEASALALKRGFMISYESIGRYYREVRRERRMHDANQSLGRVMDQFANEPMEKNLQAFVNMIIGMAAIGVLEGQVGIKSIDAVKLLGMIQNVSPTAPTDKSLQKEFDPALLQKIRQEVYGLA
jgi:hypothetical protein